MKDEIRKEALSWFENVSINDDESLGDFVDHIVDRTTDALLEAMKKELRDEFQSGNLKHNMVISPEYFLDLKMKEVKLNFSRKVSVDEACKE
ncbi:MAG: hypothetical protein KKC68_08540 [Candidatus Thermoplasmatota archaeon]|nr:hypothetical protein [Candidatus Thermoplasmatota archaeon]MBU1941808.1 hypothetical protein [Candidatus Thermoplasmatota archaeon]